MGFHAGQGQGFPRGGQLRVPNFERIMLHPARAGIDLPELLLRHRPDFPGLIEDNRPRTSRALIQ